MFLTSQKIIREALKLSSLAKSQLTSPMSLFQKVTPALLNSGILPLSVAAKPAGTSRRGSECLQTDILQQTNTTLLQVVFDMLLKSNIHFLQKG